MARVLTNPYSNGMTPLQRLTPAELVYVASTVASYSSQMISVCVKQSFETEFRYETDETRKMVFVLLSGEAAEELEHEFKMASDSKFLYERWYEIDEESALANLTKKLLSVEGREQEVVDDFFTRAFTYPPSQNQLCCAINSVTPFEQIKPDFHLVFDEPQKIGLDNLYIDNSQFFRSVNRSISLWKRNWEENESAQNVTHQEQNRLIELLTKNITPHKRGLKVNFPLAEALAWFCWLENRFPTRRERDKERLWSLFKREARKFGGIIKYRGEEECCSYCSSEDIEDKKARLEMTKYEVFDSYKKTYYKNMLSTFGLSLIAC